jgi:hypothetical protein
MLAYERNARPLSVEEKNQYLREQAPIGLLGGADWVPQTVAELEDYVECMRPKLAWNGQIQRFMDFIAGRSAELPVGRLDRAYRWASICAAMDLMPDWARHLTGTERPAAQRRFALRPIDQWKARLVRWAYPEPPCVPLARARATAGTARAA